MAAVNATPVDVKPSAAALQQQFVQVVKQVGPSVVLIQTSEGLGSGIVFDAKGDVKNGALTLFTYKGDKREQMAVVR